jgi:hypothetical protein
MVPSSSPLGVWGCRWCGGAGAGCDGGSAAVAGAVFADGRVLFRKDGSGDVWYATFKGRKQWIVSKTESKDANRSAGWAQCVEKSL